MKEYYYKINDENETEWKHTGKFGEMVFRINGHEYNLFRDYPQNIKEQDKRIFDRQNPEWAKYMQKR